MGVELSSGMHQVGPRESGAGVTNDINVVTASIAGGRCAALVFCGALSACSDCSEEWGCLTQQIPADLLVFSNVFGAELVAEGVEIVRGLLGSIDVLWTDVDGVLALFDEYGEAIAQTERAATLDGGEEDRSADVVDLLQRMVCASPICFKDAAGSWLTKTNEMCIA